MRLPELSLPRGARGKLGRGHGVVVDRGDRKIDEDPANLAGLDVFLLDRRHRLQREVAAERTLEVGHLVDRHRRLLRSLGPGVERKLGAALGASRRWHACEHHASSHRHRRQAPACFRRETWDAKLMATSPSIFVADRNRTAIRLRRTMARIGERSGSESEERYRRPRGAPTCAGGDAARPSRPESPSSFRPSLPASSPTSPTCWTAATAAALEARLEHLQEVTGADIAVVTLPTIGDYDARRMWRSPDRPGVGSRSEGGDRRQAPQRRRGGAPGSPHRRSQGRDLHRARARARGSDHRCAGPARSATR